LFFPPSFFSVDVALVSCVGLASTRHVFELCENFIHNLILILILLLTGWLSLILVVDCEWSILSSDSGNLFDKMKVDFSPVYQCLHIYESLDVGAQFLTLYKDARRAMVCDPVLQSFSPWLG
jgi:hypothetical protein